ncbi:unnamed protein product [Strongylus vulgaris]|uniref:Ubiquitin carboxyl-terminal hydrolase n=1 Tax=Strongylus vulgaris TaxID=40348 RepID=A0A3P7LBR2_STRVU|nr:unnamed protein product [Strongylus vulgaris]
MTPSMYMGRVEEVPQDQLVVRNNEYLVPIAHFDKDPGRMFGVPFFLKVSNDELLSSVRERIQARLEIPEKEYEKYKFALISSSRVVRYLDMTSNGRVNLAELGHAHVASLATSPYLGLDHMNKSRGARGSHAAEKAIKGRTPRRVTEEKGTLESDSTDMNIGSMNAVKDTFELDTDRGTHGSEKESKDMDVDNGDTVAKNVRDSASEEDGACTPPDVVMDVKVSCDDECAEPIKMFEDMLHGESEYITEEEDDPDDLYKPEGTIYLDIDGFSHFCKGSSETQQRLSKPVFVRGLPWKILAIPRDVGRVGTGARPNKALGFFLQCNADSDAVAWNCIASASLKVLGQFEGFEDHTRRITHTFYPKENDWGYSQFLTCDHLINPENGFIKDDTIRLLVHVSADAPHGVQWDSKKHAGHIGLKNQGATCYMNSILQTLYFTTKLRKPPLFIPVMQSFREYVQVEQLDGENKYDAGVYGMQPAEKGVKFVLLPPVLHLQLMRFQYDATLDANVKINDKFAFPDKLCLNEFVEDNDEDYTYSLYAVLVHSGDFHGGHYVVFINTGLRPPGEKHKPKV